MDIGDAQKAVKRGAIAAFISAGGSFVVLSAAILFQAGGDFAYFNDPLAFIDVLFVVGLGIGLLRYSRTAAVILIAYFILSKFVIWIELGAQPRLFSLIFFYFFAKAVQGTFAYHRLIRDERPSFRPALR